MLCRYYITRHTLPNLADVGLLCFKGEPVPLLAGAGLLLDSLGACVSNQDHIC